MWSRTFTVLFIISLLLGMVGAAASIFLPLLMKEEAISYSMIGAVGALTGLGGGFAQLIVGAASDRGLDRKLLILLSTLFLSLSLAASYVAKGLPAYVLISLAVGFCTPIVATISLAIISDMVSSDAMGRIMGSYRISRSIGWTVGNIALGFIADAYGSKSILLYSSFFSSVALLAALNMPGGGRLKRKVEARGKATVKLILFLFSLGFVTMAASADNYFIPLLAVDNGLSKSEVGMITALGSLVEIPFMLLSGVVTDRFGDEIVMLLGAVGFAIAYYRFNVAYVYLDFALAQALRGASFALFYAASLALIGRLSRGSATVTGYYGLSQQVGSVVGPLLGGLVSNYLGLRETFIALSAMSLSALIPMLPIHRGVKPLTSDSVER